MIVEAASPITLAAEAIRVSRHTAYMWLARGGLSPWARMLSRILLSILVLDRFNHWLDAGKVSGSRRTREPADRLRFFSHPSLSAFSGYLL